MNTYNIINPSDPLTLKAESIEVAGVAVALLGQGMYRADGDDGSTPIMFGWDEWLEEHGVSDLSVWVDDNLNSVASALESVMLGGVDDRADLDAALEAITNDEKRKEFIEKRNDRRRSSLNDIETKAHQIAAWLRQNADTAVSPQEEQ